MSQEGTLFVISSPSGGGKGSILSKALSRDSMLRYSVSATTRPPREGESNGKEYFFVDDAQFQLWIDEGKFLEWADVHHHRYGTLTEEVNKHLTAGYDVVLELDIKGAKAIRKLRNDALSVFIMPPSFEELERRLRNRGGLEERELETRLKNARIEMASKDGYDHVILNDVLDDALAEFESIVERQREGRDSKAKA